MWIGLSSIIVVGPDTQSSCPTLMACRWWPRPKGWLGGILDRCSLSSTSHFANRSSVPSPPRSTTTPAPLTGLSMCQGARRRAGEDGEAEARRDTHKSLACWEDGGWRWPAGTLFALCSAARRRAVQWKWNDPCGQAVVTSLFSEPGLSEQYGARTYRGVSDSSFFHCCFDLEIN